LTGLTKAKPTRIVTIEGQSISSPAQNPRLINAKSVSRTEKFQFRSARNAVKRSKSILVSEIRDCKRRNRSSNEVDTSFSRPCTIDAAAKTVDRIIGMYPKQGESHFAPGSRRLFVHRFAT